MNQERTQMQFDPNIQHRQSIRLKNFNYTAAGSYFVTICTRDRTCMFGKIVDGKMQLNDVGKMIEQGWHRLEGKFPEIITDEHVIMPNHIHGIITLVGADPCVRPDRNVRHSRTAYSDPNIHSNNNNRLDLHPNGPTTDDSIPKAGGHTGPPLRTTVHGIKPRQTMKPPERSINPRSKTGTHIGVPLPKVVQWFKTMTTNAYILGAKQSIWPAAYLWQRNYYDHIVRNETDLHRIREYIMNNPIQWDKDSENPVN